MFPSIFAHKAHRPDTVQAGLASEAFSAGSFHDTKSGPPDWTIENNEHVLSVIGNWPEKKAQTSLDSKKLNALSRPGSGPEVEPTGHG
ncbi:hypothetical protein MKX08_003309 [Trichoderma sp. CBMAI-0020]|nr:hypothetical protein MKX08_003309 [Trichoderma sp. CBMAI-0020]